MLGREGGMPETLTMINKLIQEHAVIHSNINHITDLSEDLAILEEVKDKSEEFTPYQYSFLNNRRLDLRQSIAHFKDGLEHHYQQEEKLLKPLLGDPVKKCLEEQHGRMLQDLKETDELLLNLSPVGLLFNGNYLKQKINVLGRTVNTLNSMEGSLLEIIGIYLS
jgi:hypothetical protein